MDGTGAAVEGLGDGVWVSLVDGVTVTCSVLVTVDGAGQDWSALFTCVMVGPWTVLTSVMVLVSNAGQDC